MATGDIATKEVATEEPPTVEAETELPEIFETVQEAVRLHHIKSIIRIAVTLVKLYIQLCTYLHHTVEQG